MKILFANKFFYHKGGSEGVLFDTARLLERKGHRIAFFSMQHPLNEPSEYAPYFVSRVDYGEDGFLRDWLNAAKILYSFEARKKIEALLAREPVALAHLNNIYHQISPSILHSLKKYKVPVVMTLHDFKMACPAYSMMRSRRLCQACSHKAYYRCVLNKCVKNSAAKSLLSCIEMYLHHVLMNIYGLVDVFIAPSMFLKEKLEEMGFKGRVEYLPNFIPFEAFIPDYRWKEQSFVYFGRLQEEKGLTTLLKAMKRIKGITLKIIGEGPQKERLEEAAKKEGLGNVSFLGYLSGARLHGEIRSAMCAVFPSEGYENNPRALIEAFALGKPAIGSNRGGVPELIKDCQTGLLFRPGDPDDFAKKAQYLLDHQDEAVRMGRYARMFVETKLSPESHYQGLMRIYGQAIGMHKGPE